MDTRQRIHYRRADEQLRPAKSAELRKSDVRSDIPYRYGLCEDSSYEAKVEDESKRSIWEIVAHYERSKPKPKLTDFRVIEEEV